MDQEHWLAFGPFRLETTQGRLWRGEQVIPLRPRSLAMLCYLVAHPCRLVTKAEVRQHVWAGTHVTDTVLRVSVQEIRAALGDAAAAARYLETVGRQGYRFLGGGDLDGPPPRTAGPIVGRQGEVDTLDGWFQRATQGTRQLVFVSGEAGVGKTTVIDLFLARLAAGRGVWSARGQCVEHYGEGEPYLPFLEALGRFGHGPERDAVLAVLRRYAPLWLAQLPALVSEIELERLQGRLQGTTQARMLRQLAEALEVLTADRALVLILEDLQWSDRSTVECLAYLAQRREPARLLVLGTYRPVEVMLRGHSLRGMVQEWCGRGQGVERRLELLAAEDVAAYVAGRLGGPVAAPLAVFVYGRTDGNALFMVNIVEHLVQQWLVERRAGQWALREGAEAQAASVPEGVRALLLRRIEALPPAARQVLEAASVVGKEFAVAAVAAGVQCPVEDIEAQCDALAAQRHFIDDTGWMVWPDATSGGRYRFQHALYQQVLYEQVGTARLVQLHQRIGVRLEAGYGARAGEIAAQLSVHFERAGEVQHAVHYWQQTGNNAARRNAYPEAVAALTRGLALLATLPESPERARHELPLQLTLGAVLGATKGLGAPEGHRVYTRAHALSQQVGEPGQCFQALHGLYRYYGTQGERRTAMVLAEQLLDLAHRQPDATLCLAAENAVGTARFFLGELATAQPHLEQSLRLYDVAQHHPFAFRSGFDPGVISGIIGALTLWGLGYADQAWHRMHAALALAHQVAQVASLTHAEWMAAILAQFCRNMPAVQVHADALRALGAEYGLAHRLEQARLLHGWVLAMQGEAARGVAQIRQGLVATQGGGLKAFRPYFLTLLTEAYAQAGQPEAGLQALAEAVTLMATTEERWWEAEVYRLQGELLLQLLRPEVCQAEACLRHALDVAQGQQARALALRAALSLSRLWQQQGKRVEAHQLLAEIYGGFTEGFNMPDLRDARALLEAAAGQGTLCEKT